jgi:branched-chain amino acid transport system ATP-binding protein
MALLEIEDLVVGYGRTQVLKDVSLSVGPGEAVALLGANGAGKSTLLHTLAGLIRPWSGRISFDGEDLTRVLAEDRPAMGLSLSPEERRIFSSLSIEENLLIAATCLRRRFGVAEARRRTQEALRRSYERFPVLGERRLRPGSHLSGGQQQMLAIARALMPGPRLLLLDEPCLGLAPKVGNQVYVALRQLREEGMSLLIVEESARRALDFVDRACVVKLGEIALEAPAADLRGNHDLLRAYFGIEAEAMVE